MSVTGQLAGYPPRPIAGSAADDAPLPCISKTLLSLFTKYSERYLRKHFQAIYLSGELPPLESSPQPTVVFLNHPSWWDPLLCLLLSRQFSSSLDHFAPIDNEALVKFAFFRRLGFFGVHQGSHNGAIHFLAKCASILSRPNSVLWITPQGEFVDPRARPTRIKSGIAQLPSLVPDLRLIPLALEYFFSGERLPAAAARFGAPLLATDFPDDTREEWAAELSAGLQKVQDELASEVITGRICDGRRIVSGQSGVTGIYRMWQRMKGIAC